MSTSFTENFVSAAQRRTSAQQTISIARPNEMPWMATITGFSQRVTLPIASWNSWMYRFRAKNLRAGSTELSDEVSSALEERSRPAQKARSPAAERTMLRMLGSIERVSKMMLYSRHMLVGGLGTLVGGGRANVLVVEGIEL